MGKQEFPDIQDKLSEIKSLDDLDFILGELTEEEKNLLVATNYTDVISNEEESSLGADFLDTLIDRTLSRLRVKETDYSQVEKTFEEGLALLTLLAEVEVNQLLSGNHTSSLREWSLMIAEDLTEFWPALKSQAHKNISRSR